MTRLYVLIAVIVVALTVFACVDAIVMDRARVRAIPKGLWVVVILLVPLVGAVLWFTVGRGSKASARRPRPIAPDDDIEFLRGLNFPKPDSNEPPQTPEDSQG